LSEAISSALIVEGQNVIVTELVERAIGERPAHDTIGSILEWLTGGARQSSSFARTIDELSWRLVAAGIPVLRVNLRGGTMREQGSGAIVNCSSRMGGHWLAGRVWK
jgi:adenylate cyclase